MLYVPLPNQPFRLYTDASDIGIRAVLTQEGPYGEQPVFYLSRKLSQPEQKYAVIKHEALAIKLAIDSFRYYLWGHRFRVITEHAPLQWLNQMKDANPCLSADI